ncbi:hypothetical protein FBY31_0077 [Arthrobacter sp. SLBN-100]|uniref:hypothetical protein n=1 Tax=Arthrobacter sp. SLBN-100 TaxID=2768450 RepID=UPI001150FDC3|nr:hypothetical protein [Arthrobacter sp. SLBN-100]TQJ66086.1 hypothetical protein FBY31_0077 [Arthrobacter sp. SLBN-100]
MNRPDPGSPDQGANQDDAAWLDLVARLEGNSPTEHDEPATEQKPGAAGGAPAASGRAATFRDFDPLGLAGAAPAELSAADRQEASSAGRNPNAPAADGNAAGPRDYDAPEDGGEFIPEEPPSLAGTDPLTMLAWLAAVGGPVALLFSAMFWRSAPLLAIVGIVAVFVLGTVYLITKLPQEKDDNDDGARV